MRLLVITFFVRSGLYHGGACHTSILHLVANIGSIFNSTILRSNRFIVAATESSSRVLADVFQESSFLAYTSCGYNCLYGLRHVKQYSEAESLCAALVRDVQPISVCSNSCNCTELKGGIEGSLYSLAYF